MNTKLLKNFGLALVVSTSMATINFQSAFAATLFATTIDTTTTGVYGNCSFTHGCNSGAFGNGGYVWGAAQFSISADSIVETVGFTALVDGSNPPLSIDWKILSDNGLPQTMLAEAFSASFVTTTNPDLASVSSGVNYYDIFDYVVDISDLSLSSGIYWVAFHVNNNAAVRDTYWAASEGGDELSARSIDGGSWENDYFYSDPNHLGLAISITGSVDDISAVPVPAALPLFGTGLAIMGFIGWRRKRKSA